MGIPVTPPASLAPPAGDQADAVVTGNFQATGTSAVFPCWGAFNVLIYGSGGPNGNWDGSVQLERSFNGGTTWIICGVGGAGQQAVYTSSGTGSDVSIVVSEPERGVAYRLHCTNYVSGQINYRLSTSGQAAMSMGVPPA